MGNGLKIVVPPDDDDEVLEDEDEDEEEDDDEDDEVDDDDDALEDDEEEDDDEDDEDDDVEELVLDEELVELDVDDEVDELEDARAFGSSTITSSHPLKSLPSSAPAMRTSWNTVVVRDHAQPVVGPLPGSSGVSRPRGAAEAAPGPRFRDSSDMLDPSLSGDGVYP